MEDQNLQPGVAFPINPSSTSVLNDQFENNLINTLWNNVVYYKTTFDAIDKSLITCNAGAGSSCPSTGIAGVLVVNTEGNASGSYGDVDRTPLYAGALSWQRDSRMRAGIQVGSIAAQTAYIIRGSRNIVSPYYGFKVTDSTLQGVYYAGTGGEKSVNLQQVAASSIPLTSSNFYVCEAQYNANNAVKFLVNGTYKGMIRTSDAPVSPLASKIAFYNFRITANSSTSAGRTLGISFFEYIQEK